MQPTIAHGGEAIIAHIETHGMSETIDFLVGYCQAQKENIADEGGAMESFSWDQIKKDLLKARFRARVFKK